MMRHLIKESFWVLLVLGLMHVTIGPATTHAQPVPGNGQASAIPAEQSPGNTKAPATTDSRTSTTNGQRSPTLTDRASANAQASATIKIGPGDLLEITVFDVPEMTQQVRVGADGKAELELIGNTAVAGLTAQEAAQTIARELRDRKFLVHPQVNVLIKDYASQGVSVMGEVQHPGVYQVLGPRSLLDVISMAGGLTNVADTRITVKRRSGTEDKVTVKLKTDDPDSSLSNNVQIYPGDLVLVPRAGVVYVLGDVNKPGGFVMQDSGKISLLQALAQAGGASKTASLSNAVLLRKSAQGQGYVTHKLDVSKIERGQGEDVELGANDILFVPGNKLKGALATTQSIATSIGSASIYAVVH
jgi:polysaccharide biosynthesis/export protein